MELVFIILFFIFPFIFMSLFLAALIFFIRRVAKAKDVWPTIAQTYGLTYQPSSFLKGPMMSGTFESVPLRITTQQDSSAFHTQGSMRKNYVLICARIPSAHCPMMTLHREGALQKIGKALAPDIQVGDEEFDKRLLLRGQDKQAIRAVLQDTNLKGLLLTSFQHVPTLGVDQHTVHIRFQAGASEEFYRYNINLCVQIAQALARSADAIFEPAPPAQSAQNAQRTPNVVLPQIPVPSQPQDEFEDTQSW